MTKVLVEIVFDTDNKADVEKEIDIILKNAHERDTNIYSFSIKTLKD